jgi:hypothetical protein
MRTVQPSTLLRRAFVVDAVASGAVALAHLADTDLLVGTLALPRPLLVESGAFLVAYAALVAVMARASRLPAALVGLVVAGNVGWTLGCLALIVDRLVAPSALGIAWLVAQAVFTAVMAAWEFAGLKASTPVASIGDANPRPDW